MPNVEREREIFKAFLKVKPDFAGEPIREWYHVSEWYGVKEIQRPAPPDHDRPDIICVTESGRRIGVELKGVAE